MRNVPFHPTGTPASIAALRAAHPTVPMSPLAEAEEVNRRQMAEIRAIVIIWAVLVAWHIAWFIAAMRWLVSGN